MFAELIDRIIEQHRSDPKYKILIDENTLLAAAMEETGYEITLEQLSTVISNFLSGKIEADDHLIYTGAIYACEVASNNCFGIPEQHDVEDDVSVDYEVNWVLNENGRYAAEIRPI